MFKLLLSVAFTLFLVSCESSSPETELPSPSKWAWNCCGQGFGGTFTLVREGKAITGVFSDTVAKSGGNIRGTLTADSMVFVRSWDTGSQTIQMALTKDGLSAAGVIFGSSLSGKRDMHAIRLE